MRNEKEIIRADIRTKYNKIIIGLWVIIWTIVFVIGFVSDSEEFDDGSVRIGFFHLAKLYSSHSYGLYPGSYSGQIFWEYVLIVFLLAYVLIGAPLIGMIRNRANAAKCSLKLTDKGLSGQRKKFFSSAQLQLPMDKIDNIMVTENIINKIQGGKTVAVRSASGLVKFPWVQNADEFVKLTLAEIEKYNQSLKNVDKTLVSAIAGNSALKAQPEKSAAQKIKDLKELLDSGLITQDEFDAKKKDLLDKM